MTRRGLILFVALSIAWGIPYLLIKVAVSELDPATVVFGRSALGALAAPAARVPAASTSSRCCSRWRPLLAYTAIEIIIPWYFLSSAEQKLPSSTAGLLIAAVPLVGVAVAFAMGRPEHLTRSNWLGIVLGMLGVAALVGLDVAGSDLVAVARDRGRRGLLRDRAGDPLALDVGPARGRRRHGLPARSPPWSTSRSSR